MEVNSSNTSDSVNRLMQELAKLPGIGPKSAQRLTYHLLRTQKEQVISLAEAIMSLKNSTRLCSVCFNIADSEFCPICRNEKRDKSSICVVEQPQDILALEHSGIYKGLYHVLHGAISPTDGIGISDIRIEELMVRLKDGDISEVILATNPTLEGEQTAMYLNKVIIPLGVKVTRLARGLPFGTELEYADDVTLSRALEGRQELK
ncbi:MAG: recombination mediator RecR [Dehalococcoidales bacterium]|nr:recombination mediator RecR [Dehalococcoidales bacterium]MDD3994277.1 recombination mediator RecR [Dehalococcoidales bacterium]